MPARHAPARCRAFTLLEVLLAITILASMSLLIASLWGQSAAWGDDNTAEHERMRLQRVLALMRDQWSTRTSSVKMDDFGRSVKTSHDRIAFTTTTPILHGGVALVEVSYEIERDLNAAAAGPLGAWKLVYTEMRLGDPSQPAEGQDQRDTAAESIDLLSGCAELRFERFGPDKPIQLDSKKAPAPGDATISDAQPTDAQEAKEPGQEDAPDPADAEDRWRPYEESDAGLIPAVRLIGNDEGERFSCLFVIAPLR